MSWGVAVSRTLLPTRAEEELKIFIRSQLPGFRAPIEPLAWRREVSRLRRRALANVFLRGFPKSVLKKKPRVVWGESLRPDPSYRIRKLRYEILPNYWIPALLYEPTGMRSRTPVVLNPNGHHSGGKAVTYKQVRCANLARRGLLALNIEFIGMGELAADSIHNNIAHLNLTGLAGVGLFYLAMQKGLDVLLDHPRADRKRVAVTGLSGGGWQTIVFSALDPRVTAAVPVAGYTSIRARLNVPADIGDLEQVPVDMTTVLDYQHMTAMLAPRPALLILNDNDDCCFAAPRTKPVIYDAVLPTYKAFRAESVFETYNNRDPGTHNYEADNRSQFYRFLNRHFGLNSPETDIHSESDVLQAPLTEVGLPAEQETVLGLALKRGRALAAMRGVPRTAAERQRLRKAVSQCIRLPRYEIQEEVICRTGDMSQRLLHMGPWTVPLTAWNPPAASGAELRLANNGRPGCGAPLPDGSRHVYAPEICGTGENAAAPLLYMILESTGHRLLGIQVAQILACADIAARQTGMKRLHLIANGENSCFAALVAAALRPDRFETLTVNGHLTSLLGLTELGGRYESCLPMFCFGLLQVANVRELKACLEHVVYLQPGFVLPPERLRAERGV